jgi:hypothetical protein
MSRHIQVNGTPWCQCCAGLFTAEMHQQSWAHGLFIFCADSQPSDEAAVEFLKTHGVPAELVEGPCPTLMEGRTEPEQVQVAT